MKTNPTPARKACIAVQTIFDHLSGSDFVTDHGTAAMDALKKYGPDMSVDVLQTMTEKYSTEDRRIIGKYWKVE